jgi:hypothetical protein
MTQKREEWKSKRKKRRKKAKRGRLIKAGMKNYKR